MTEKYLICENCKNVIARFDPSKITLPVTSTPFSAKFPPERLVRPPWRPGVRSAAMKCPRCPKRAFNTPDPTRLYCSDSFEGLNPYYWDIQPEEIAEEPGPKAYACPKCGKIYASRAYFDRYHQQCEGSE